MNIYVHEMHIFHMLWTSFLLSEMCTSHPTWTQHLLWKTLKLHQPFYSPRFCAPSTIAVPYKLVVPSYQFTHWKLGLLWPNGWTCTSDIMTLKGKCWFRTQWIFFWAHPTHRDPTIHKYCSSKIVSNILEYNACNNNM